MSTTPFIFISYANPDRERVLPFYDYLSGQRFNVWMDCRNLKGGQNWGFEVTRALDKATLVLTFISHNSVDRRGYVQRELKFALDKLNEKLIDDIYLVPVLLDDDVPIPRQLREIQCIMASEPECKAQIIDAINHQLQRLSIARSDTQIKEGVVWEKRTLQEEWDGPPGYVVELQYLDLESHRFPNVGEISDYIRGRLLSTLFLYRQQKIEARSEHVRRQQQKYWPANTYDALCGEPSFNGYIVSIQYGVRWCGAGAHPNHHFETYNFLLSPLVLISSLSMIFKEPDKALGIVQTYVRNALYEALAPRDGTHNVDREWIERGTSTWDDFQAFTFTNEGIHLLFAAYEVAAYASGPQFATLPFPIVAPLMRPEYLNAMHLERLP